MSICLCTHLAATSLTKCSAQQFSASGQYQVGLVIRRSFLSSIGKQGKTHNFFPYCACAYWNSYCHAKFGPVSKNFGDLHENGDPGPPFSRENGDPFGKMSNFRECPVKPHLDLSHRYLLRKWIKWNNPVAVFHSKFRMENDAQLEQGRFTFNDIHRYLRDGCYPDGYTKPDKLSLRKRAKFFCTRGADFIYVGG